MWDFLLVCHESLLKARNGCPDFVRFHLRLFSAKGILNPGVIDREVSIHTLPLQVLAELVPQAVALLVLLVFQFRFFLGKTDAE